jgi:hypothetical protein
VHFASAVGDRETPGNGVRIGNPIFGNNVYIEERCEIKLEIIWKESMQARWQGKGSRIGNHLAAKSEARKKAHGTRPQAVGGVQGQGGRVTAAGFELPDLIIDVIGLTQAKIRGQGECQRVAGAESPIAHVYKYTGVWAEGQRFCAKILKYSKMSIYRRDRSSSLCPSGRDPGEKKFDEKL